ncbi:SpaA isopeptide-forming pilin-related protein, partial [Bacillus sp. E214]|uniref:SpaA isopeptide-forming pilin-related protein n=1 Tax=Bacillus sp. E214 TaxID=2587156 RepID=UPI0011DF102E
PDVELTLENIRKEEPKGSIQITKVETGTDKKLKGAVLRLYDNPEGTGQSVGEQTSDENGLVKFENLSFGTYYLKEIQAPEGYELLTGMKEIVVNEEHPDVELTLENIRKEEPKGSIQITKVETGTDKKLKGAVLRLYDNPEGTGQSVGEQTSDENGLVKFENLSFGTYYLKEIQAPEGYELLTGMKEIIVNEENPDAEITLENVRKEEPKGSIEFTKVDKEKGHGLEGAVFGLFDNKNCEGEPKAKATSDTEGVVKFEQLTYGTYYVKELTAPEDYQLSGEIRAVTVDKELVTTGKFTNERIKELVGTIEFTKVDKEKGHGLEGAVFGLFDNKNCEGEPKAKVTSDTEGVVKFEQLTYGTYYVKELTAPEDYQLSGEIRAVTVDKELVTTGKFTNERIKELVGTIQFTKVDKETGKGLEGAVFALYDNAECKGEAKYKATSNNDGLVRFAGVRYGKYYLKEIKAPEGYQASVKILPIEVNSSHLNLDKIEDEALTGTIEFTKVDKETGKGLEGAVFALYDNEECQGEAKYKATSNNDGLVRFTDVRYGTYYFKEIKAPEGYQLSDKITKIEVNKSLLNLGKIQDEAIKDPTGSIELKKIDSKDKKVLEGAEFELYLDGKVIKTGKTDKNGSLNFENLSYGTYEIKETKAPKGYQLSDEVKKVEINSSKKVVIEFENTLINQSIMPGSPSDSDSSNQLVDSDSDSNAISSDEVMTGSDSKQQTGEGMFLNGLPQTGDALTRALIVLGLIFVFAGVIFLTKRAKN